MPVTITSPLFWAKLHFPSRKKKSQRVPSRAKAIHTRLDSHLMCFIILLMQFNQNTVTRYEYKISLLLPALLSFESLENNFSWLRRMTKMKTRGNGKEKKKKHHRRYFFCSINMNGAWSMQKMKIFCVCRELIWDCVLREYGDNKWLVLHG